MKVKGKVDRESGEVFVSLKSIVFMVDDCSKDMDGIAKKRFDHLKKSIAKLGVDIIKNNPSEDSSEPTDFTNLFGNNEFGKIFGDIFNGGTK